MAEPSVGLEISHPHLHGLLADGYWKDGVFTRFNEVDLKAIEETFAERVLAQLHKRELITDDDVVQILSQDHTGFGVWFGDPFHYKESEQFVALYIARGSYTRLVHVRNPGDTVAIASPVQHAVLI